MLIRLAAVAVLLTASAPIEAQTMAGEARTRMSDGDVMLRAFRDRVLLDTLAIWENVPLSLALTYARVQDVLGALKIPVTNADPEHGILWNAGFVTRGGKLAGKANSQLMRCGFGPSGDHADQWRVTVAYAVYVKPVPGTDAASKLGIALIGQAKDIAGANSPAVLCNTKGVLEAEIAKLVRNAPAP